MGTLGPRGPTLGPPLGHALARRAVKSAFQVDTLKGALARRAAKGAFQPESPQFGKIQKVTWFCGGFPEGCG